MADVTHLLDAAEAGDPHAAGQLLPLVYDELRRLAAAQMAHERPGQTLDATALVHEAYLRLIKNPKPDESDPDVPRFAGRAHFYAAAAEAMRRILVDNARRKRAVKRGGEFARHDLPADQLAAPAGPDPLDLLALDDALTRFTAHAPRKAELVKLRYFAGRTLPEAAALLGIAASTAEDDWTYAKAWLRREMCRGDRPAG